MTGLPATPGRNGKPEFEESNSGTYGTIVLLGSKGDKVKAQFPLMDDNCTIGRTETCDIRIHRAEVSKLHAQLDFELGNDDDEDAQNDLSIDAKALLTVHSRYGVVLENGRTVHKQEKAYLDSFCTFIIGEKRFSWCAPGVSVKVNDTLSACKASQQKQEWPETPPALRNRQVRSSLRQAVQLDSSSSPRKSLGGWLGFSSKSPSKPEQSIDGNQQEEQNVPDDDGDIVTLDTLFEEDSQQNSTAKQLPKHVQTPKSASKAYTGTNHFGLGPNTEYKARQDRRQSVRMTIMPSNQDLSHRPLFPLNHHRQSNNSEYTTPEEDAQKQQQELHTTPLPKKSIDTEDLLTSAHKLSNQFQQDQQHDDNDSSGDETSDEEVESMLVSPNSSLNNNNNNNNDSSDQPLQQSPEEIKNDNDRPSTPSRIFGSYFERFRDRQVPLESPLKSLKSYLSSNSRSSSAEPESKHDQNDSQQKTKGDEPPQLERRASSPLPPAPKKLAPITRRHSLRERVLIRSAVRAVRKSASMSDLSSAAESKRKEQLTKSQTDDEKQNGQGSQHQQEQPKEQKQINKQSDNIRALDLVSNMPSQKPNEKVNKPEKINENSNTCISPQSVRKLSVTDKQGLPSISHASKDKETSSESKTQSQSQQPMPKQQNHQKYKSQTPEQRSKKNCENTPPNQTVSKSNNFQNHHTVQPVFKTPEQQKVNGILKVMTDAVNKVQPREECVFNSERKPSTGKRKVHFDFEDNKMNNNNNNNNPFDEPKKRARISPELQDVSNSFHASPQNQNIIVANVFTENHTPDRSARVPRSAHRPATTPRRAGRVFTRTPTKAVQDAYRDMMATKSQKEDNNSPKHFSPGRAYLPGYVPPKPLANEVADKDTAPQIFGVQSEVKDKKENSTLQYLLQSPIRKLGQKPSLDYTFQFPSKLDYNNSDDNSKGLESPSKTSVNTTLLRLQLDDAKRKAGNQRRMEEQNEALLNPPNSNASDKASFKFKPTYENENPFFGHETENSQYSEHEEHEEHEEQGKGQENVKENQDDQQREDSTTKDYTVPLRSAPNETVKELPVNNDKKIDNDLASPSNNQARRRRRSSGFVETNFVKNTNDTQVEESAKPYVRRRSCSLGSVQVKEEGKESEDVNEAESDKKVCGFSAPTISSKTRATSKSSNSDQAESNTATSTQTKSLLPRARSAKVSTNDTKASSAAATSHPPRRSTRLSNDKKKEPDNNTLTTAKRTTKSTTVEAKPTRSMARTRSVPNLSATSSKAAQSDVPATRTHPARPSRAKAQTGTSSQKNVKQDEKPGPTAGRTTATRTTRTVSSNTSNASSTVPTAGRLVRSRSGTNLKKDVAHQNTESNNSTSNPTSNPSSQPRRTLRTRK